MSNNKDLLNDLVDLRTKKNEEISSNDNKEINSQQKMEDMVPVVEITEDELIKDELGLESNQDTIEQVEKETTDTPKAEQEVKSEQSSTNKTIVITKKDKFKKFLNLKEKQEKPKEDIEAKQAKGYAWLAYILFFIPLFINRKNSFVKFHANEGLEINIIDIISIIFILIGALVKPVSIITILLVILGVGLLSLTFITKIIMIIHSIRGLRKKSPWLFNLTIID